MVRGQRKGNALLIVILLVVGVAYLIGSGAIEVSGVDFDGLDMAEQEQTCGDVGGTCLDRSSQCSQLGGSVDTDAACDTGVCCVTGSSGGGGGGGMVR